MSGVLNKRQKRLIGLACVMKIRHFESAEVQAEFPEDKLKGVIEEYEEIMELVGFDYKKQR